MRVEREYVNQNQSRELEAISSGSGDATIVFIPGLGGNATQFADDVLALSDDRRCIALSMRGHGASFRAQDAADYTLRQLADDVVALLDSQGVRQAAFVGNSLGGLVCYEVLRARPDMVTSVATFGTTAELDSTGFTEHAVVGMTKLLGARGMGWLTSKTASRDGDVSRFVGRMIRDADTAALASLASAVAKYSYIDVLASSSIPVLLLRGEDDSAINAELASTLSILAERENATVLGIPEAGHFMNLERPECFRSVLRWFWAHDDKPVPACAKLLTNS
jgi:pimeloyl-ACP methyl ester carboxylesterase